MKISRANGALYSLSRFTPQKTLINLYYSLIYSLVSQDIIIWGGAPSTFVKALISKINNALRIILNVKKINNIPTVSTSEMYKSLNLLNFNDIYKFNLLKFIHSAFYYNKFLFDNYFKDLVNDNNYNMRRDRVRLPDVRLDVVKMGAIFQACKLYNEVPENLLLQMSKSKLKKKFYEYVNRPS